MDMKKQLDIRVVRTQNALLESLEEIIATKKLSQITITELCSKAAINRNTFYYHYNNIYELLNENKLAIVEEMTSILVDNKRHDNSGLINICRCIKNHPHFLNILISPNCDLDFFNEVFNLAADKTEVFIINNENIQNSRDRYLTTYCPAAANAVIRSWIIKGMVESPEEIADIIWQCSKKGVFSLMFPNEKFN